jgi:hypothetical protein
MTRIILLVLAALLCRPGLASSQSLADVARAEEARRNSMKRPAKVYTNETLKPDFTSPTQPADAATSSGEASEAAPTPDAGEAPAGAKAPAATPAEPSKAAQDAEAGWRKRMADARAELQRSQMFADALQSRINALSTDFVNRDDPAQRAVVEQDRQKAIAELERVKAEIAQQTKAVAGIEEEARKAGVPAGWLR